MEMKDVAICSGGDWIDADVVFVKVPADTNLGQKEQEYNAWLKTIPRSGLERRKVYKTFVGWLKANLPTERSKVEQYWEAAVDPADRKPAYSMDAHRAAEMLGVSMERIEMLVADGLLGHTYRHGALWVSSGDVSTMVATQLRVKRRCRVMDALLGLAAPENALPDS